MGVKAKRSCYINTFSLLVGKKIVNFCAEIYLGTCYTRYYFIHLQYVLAISIFRNMYSVLMILSLFIFFPEYPLAVKLGTITQDGNADVYSYDEDDMVLDPNLVKHLAVSSCYYIFY